jgi:protein gp37
VNRQYDIENGQKVNRKIEWTDYTWNVLVGCLHDCRWTMAGGKEAGCYAKKIVEGRWLKDRYPEGFEKSYFHPERLDEPIRLKTPAKIFPDSVSDLMGAWVQEEHRQAIFDVMERTPQHIYQALTKNAPGYAKYPNSLPKNMWVGVSSPPDHMLGQDLSDAQKLRYLNRALRVLTDVAVYGGNVTWMSFEPLSQDWASVVKGYPNALKWAVIGAASDGRRYFPPEEKHVRALIEVLDDQGCKIFFKGNLRSLPWAAQNWREEYPTTENANA